MPATLLRSLFAAGSGITIDGTGTIAAAGGAGFAGVSTFNARSGPITLTSSDLTSAGGALAASLPQGATSQPLADGAAAAGSSPLYARQDHVHPTDPTRLATASNLSDVANAPAARGNLGLGGAAVLNVGAVSGTVAAGDDSRIAGALAVAALPTTPFIATGGSAGRTLPAHAADTLSVWDFGVVGNGVADDSAALAAACTALRGTGRRLYVPGNCRIRMGGAAQAWLSGMSIVADAGHEIGTPGPGVYGQRGGTILLTDTARAPFVVSDDWALEGLIFNWPNQTEAAAIAAARTPGSTEVVGVPGYPVIVTHPPAIYPPLIVPHQTGSVGDPVRNWRVSRCQIQNAFDVIDLTSASGVGPFWFEANQSFGLRWHFRLNSVGDEHFIRDSHFTPGAYTYGILGTSTTNLRDYATLNATVMRIEGNGSATTVAGTAVEGTRMSGCYAFAMRYGIHAVGGSLNLATLVGNSFDQVSTPICVESGGLIEGTVMGGTWLSQALLDGELAASAISVTGGPASNGSTLLVSNVDMAVTAGAGIVWTDPGPNSALSVSGGRIVFTGNISVGNPFAAVNFTAAQGVLTLAGVPMTTTQPASVGAFGVFVAAAASSAISACTFEGWNIPVVYNATTGAHAVTGCISIGTMNGAASGVLGTGAGIVAQAGNNWDVGNNWTVITVPTGLEGGIKMAGPDAALTVVAAAKGSGGFLAQNDTGPLMEVLPNGASAQANYLLVLSAPSGVAPQIFPAGAAPSIDLSISGKGSGAVDIANANLTGVPVAPTAAAGTSTTQVATTGFVAGAVQGTGLLLTTGSTYSMQRADKFVVVRKATGSLTAIMLPTSPPSWTPYVVKDGKGDASTNKITITGGTPIDGTGSFVIDQAFESVTLVFNGVDWSVI